jgi:hypothetical protein
MSQKHHVPPSLAWSGDVLQSREHQPQLLPLDDPDRYPQPARGILSFSVSPYLTTVKILICGQTKEQENNLCRYR